MDILIKKLYKFGIYGDKLNLLTEEEIKLLEESSYAQIYHKDETKYLEEDLEYTPKICTNDSNTSNRDNCLVRIEPSHFWRIIAPIRFRDNECLKILDILLKQDDYIKQSDLAIATNTNTKKVSYVLKSLRKCDLILQTMRAGVSYVMLDVDKLHETFKIQNGPPVIPKSFSLEVPIVQDIRKRIKNSESGILSNDLRDEYGLSPKRGLALLKKLETMYSNEIACKTVFDGKTRKHFFYKMNSDVTLKIKEKGFITSDDRITSIHALLEDKAWVIVNINLMKEFQQLLGSKYRPEKKTIIAAAIKAGLKVYNFIGPKYRKVIIIAKEEVNISDVLDGNETKKVNENEFSRLIMSKFVKNLTLLSQDNLYEVKLSKRVEIVCKFIKERHGFSLFNFSESLVKNLSLLKFLQIVPNYSFGLLEKLFEECEKLKGSKPAQSVDFGTCKSQEQILDHLNLGEFLSARINKSWFKDLYNKFHTKRPFLSFLEPLWWLDCVDLFIRKSKLEGNLPLKESEICYDRESVFDNEAFVQIKLTNRTTLRDLIGEIELNDLCLKLKENYETSIGDRARLELPVFYVPQSERMKLYYASESVEDQNEFLELVNQYINNSKSATRNELVKFFKHKCGINVSAVNYDNENVKEHLFTKIKYDLYVKGSLDPLDYNGYSNVTIKEVLSDLQRARYAKFKIRHLSLTTIQAKESVKRRLFCKSSQLFSNLNVYRERDTIYKIYFDVIFVNLIASGTMSYEDLVRKCKVFELFELIRFLKDYEDVFATEEIGQSKHVWVKIEIDPFEIK